MSAVRSRGNKATEVRLVHLLRSYGIKGWRRHPAILGNPDFVFKGRRLVVFVDGCFWHGCRWHCRMPKSNKAYWVPKIARNKERDAFAKKALQKLGWRVHRIWEHSLRRPEKAMARLHAALGNVPNTRLNGANHANVANHNSGIRRNSRDAFRKTNSGVPKREKIRRLQSV